MSFQNVDQGIAAIQAGNVEEGARLLRIALRNPELSGTMRAVACLWLAETSSDPQAKRTYYNDALTADPNNPQVRQRVEAFLTTQMMPPAAPPGSTPSAPMPPVSVPEAPVRGGFTISSAPATPATSPNPFGAPLHPPAAPMAGVNPFAPATPPALPKTGPLGPVIQPAPTPSGGMYHIAGVLGGPNGPGTAFFVAREGLLATSRYVVGGVDRVTVELQTGRQLPGYVVRAYPEYDLALIYAEQQVNDLIPITPLPRVPEDSPVTVITYSGQTIQGRRRATRRMIAPQWFPTDITDLPDAGGGPMLDNNSYLIGMVTRNTASTSGFLYGLHINAIRTLVEAFRQETLTGQGLYCSDCGYYSRAAAAGGYYCESCGGVMPQAEAIPRFQQPHLKAFYEVHERIPCRYCNAEVGFHAGLCLRCGQAQK